MSSENTKTKSRARLWDLIGAALIAALGVWWHWPTWLIVLLVAVDLINPAERWKELLDALRGSRKTQEEPDDAAEYDRQIEIAHDKSEFKHIPSLPWGDVLPATGSSPSVPSNAAECLCGIPNCHGHEMIDGKIEIPNHPLGHVIVHEGGRS